MLKCKMLKFKMLKCKMLKFKMLKFKMLKFKMLKCKMVFLPGQTCMGGMTTTELRRGKFRAGHSRSPL
jgi:hypothetical protein